MFIEIPCKTMLNSEKKVERKNKEKEKINSESRQWDMKESNKI